MIDILKGMIFSAMAICSCILIFVGGKALFLFVSSLSEDMQTAAILLFAWMICTFLYVVGIRQGR